jgi:hypothetical protein
MPKTLQFRLVETKQVRRAESCRAAAESNAAYNYPVLRLCVAVVVTKRYATLNRGSSSLRRLGDAVALAAVACR